MNNIISIKDLNKKYKNFELNISNLEIKKGAITGFIGENGAGKTTTIKSILNLINIDSGNIKIFDKDNKLESIKEDIGVILDDSFLPLELNINDINKIMKILYKNWDELMYYKYIDKFNLPNNIIIKDYSTGMLMKLKVSIALSHNARLLILDEPTSGLDPVVRSELLDILQEFLLDESHSVFISSHITKDLEQIADYIIFIHDGEIILNDKKDNLINNYGIVKCSEEEFKKLDKEDILKYQKNTYDIKVLINNKNKIKKKYNIKTIDNATLDDTMLLNIKGDSYE